jgi:hypothetical protein
MARPISDVPKKQVGRIVQDFIVDGEEHVEVKIQGPDTYIVIQGSADRFGNDSSSRGKTRADA